MSTETRRPRPLSSLLRRSPPPRWASGGLEVLAKPLANGDVSVALFNETGSTATITTTAAAVGKTGVSAYTLTDLWSGASSTTSGTIRASVPAHGTVMYRVAGGPSGGGGTSVTGELHAVGAGKCLDVPNSTTTAGTRVEIWSAAVDAEPERHDHRCPVRPVP